MQNERKKILEGNDLFTSLAWFKKKRIQFKNINSQGLMNCMSIVWKKKKNKPAFKIDLQVEDMSEMKTNIYFSLQTLNFLFCIGVQLINNVVISGEQWRDSVIHIWKQTFLDLECLLLDKHYEPHFKV